MTAEDLDIELTGDVLTVRGERTHPQLGSDRIWYRFERGYGEFQRILQVPRGLDPDTIDRDPNAGMDAGAVREERELAGAGV